MTENLNKFDVFVIKSILANNPYGINEVNNIEGLKSRYFIREEYPEIEKLIRQGNIEAIKTLPDNKSEESEYLDVMIFTDQNKKRYAVTVYDSDELLQDPQIIEIYSL